MLITIKVEDRDDAELIKEFIEEGLVEMAHECDNVEWIHQWLHILEDIEAQISDERNV